MPGGQVAGGLGLGAVGAEVAAGDSQVREIGDLLPVPRQGGGPTEGDDLGGRGLDLAWLDQDVGLGAMLQPGLVGRESVIHQLLDHVLK